MPDIALDISSERARLVHIGSLLCEINQRLCTLYKSDYIFKDTPALYKKLVSLNDRMLCAVERNTSIQYQKAYQTIERLPEAQPYEQHDEKESFMLFQKIEITLCEVCDRYEAIIENNPCAKKSLVDFFMQIKIEIVAFIKHCRRTVQWYL